MIDHQDQKETKRELTMHDSLPQNGVSKRGMRTKAKQAHTILLASGLPHLLWEEEIFSLATRPYSSMCTKRKDPIL